MTEEKFNLLDEKWIKVLNAKSEVETVSLKDVFQNAHLYSDLAGEIKAQDTAMLRFLLAVLHTVISRYEIDGEESEIEESEEALDRWESYWKEGKFNSEIFDQYLEEYRNRFWLIHPEFPFWQTPIEKGTYYTAAKLQGDLSESNNKVRLFQTKSLSEKNAISYDEAARWLLFLNAYDDTSAKKTQKDLPSPGAGWLGKIGQVYARGNNLFETCMLNCVLLQDGKECWPENAPRWEMKKEPSKERVEIAPPDNLAALYTLSSRRLFLEDKEGKITGFSLLGGDFFDRTNYFVEQHTIWRGTENKKKKSIDFTPKRISKNRQFWREFSNLFMAVNSSGSKIHQPGIVLWIQKLKSEGLISQKKTIEFITASVQYGDKDFFINDLTGDSLTLHSSLLEEFSDPWRRRLAREVENCEQLANISGNLSRNIALASGAGGDTILENSYGRGQALMYESINDAFKQWIENLEPQQKDFDSFLAEWYRTVKRIAGKVEYELSQDAPVESYLGRKTTYKDKEKIVSLPIAQNIYWKQVMALYPGKEETNAEA